MTDVDYQGDTSTVADWITGNKLFLDLSVKISPNDNATYFLNILGLGLSFYPLSITVACLRYTLERILSLSVGNRSCYK